MPAVRLGRDSETGQEVRIGDIERRSGFYILGKPGMGKSALEVNMMLQDAEHGHGLFFLDPHGDAISDLARRLPEKRVDGTLLFDPSDETHSFGINLLHCTNIKSLKEREATYTRAYNVFYKLWEEQWGVWLQLILQNVLRAFIENQAYTLADVPLFLNPRNFAFREHILRNTTHNPAVVDFWRSEFFERRERDQQERVDAALTRINTLLTNPYVRHIVGQHQTTINFEHVLKGGLTLLMRLSANFPEDVKRFIGTILFSELLHAVRNREKLPEEERTQYCIFIDEFQNFANSEDIRTLITEGRKFGVTITYAHQERFGQFAENQRLMGATLATASKALFQATVIDAGELAPEVAEQVEPTEIRREAELVISPHAIEDIWERGHPDREITYIRRKYFWIVEALKNSPQEDYFIFDPTRYIPPPFGETPGRLHLNAFDDWEMYRSSAEMLQRGIALLNHYYHDWMQARYVDATPVSEAELALVLQILECLGGVFGLCPVMEPYVPEEKSPLLARTINDGLAQAHETEIRKQIQALKDEIQYLKDHGVKEERWGSVSQGGSFTRGGSTGPGATGGSSSVSSSQSSSRSTPILRYVGGAKEDYERQEAYMKDLWQQIFALEKSLPRQGHSYVGSLMYPRHAKALQTLAIEAGMASYDVAQLIQWQVRPMPSYEKERLIALVRNILDTPLLERQDPARRRCSYDRASEEYSKAMTMLPLLLQYRPGDLDHPSSEVRSYWQKVIERTYWQTAELTLFLTYCFRQVPLILLRAPIKVPSGKYDETRKVERTQQDLINEMAMELASLPQYTAYAKLIAEQNGMQRVLKHKIQTLPLPPAVRGAEIEVSLMEKSHVLCQERELIEWEIRERQDRWRLRSPEQPPEEPPPPTNF
jgi:hypothetical protein